MVIDMMAASESYSVFTDIIPVPMDSCIIFLPAAFRAYFVCVFQICVELIICVETFAGRNLRKHICITIVAHIPVLEITFKISDVIMGMESGVYDSSTGNAFMRFTALFDMGEIIPYFSHMFSLSHSIAGRLHNNRYYISKSCQNKVLHRDGDYPESGCNGF